MGVFFAPWKVIFGGLFCCTLEGDSWGCFFAPWRVTSGGVLSHLGRLFLEVFYYTLEGDSWGVLLHLGTEMEKRADTADISVLFFWGCANFLAEYALTN